MSLTNLIVEDLKAHGFHQERLTRGRLHCPILGLTIYEIDLTAAFEDEGLEDIPRILLEGSRGARGPGWGLSSVVWKEALIPSLQRLLGG